MILTPLWLEILLVVGVIVIAVPVFAVLGVGMIMAMCESSPHYYSTLPQGFLDSRLTGFPRFIRFNLWKDEKGIRIWFEDDYVEDGYFLNIPVGVTRGVLTIKSRVLEKQSEGAIRDQVRSVARAFFELSDYSRINSIQVEGKLAEIVQTTEFIRPKPSQ